MRRYLAMALACALAAVSVSALALGLGEIRLNSYLNQRLDAEIELVSAAADELESLNVSLAGHDAYARYGLDRSPILNSLQFRVVRRPNGTAYLRVTSTESIKEPFLTFLIEASWSRGRVLREYTVLLDPPTFAGSGDAAREEAFAQAPAVTPERGIQAEESRAAPTQPRQEPVTGQPRIAEEQRGDVISIPSLDSEAEDVAGRGDRIRVTGRLADEADAESTYGPIQRNENLWSIAMRLRPDESVTVNQMMLALYRANPEAFQGNINRLKAGYILRIPPQSEIRSLGRTEAFREAQRHNEEWERSRSGGAVQRAQPAEEPVVENATVVAEPELSLVAPDEERFEPSGEIDAGGESDAAGAAGSQELDALAGDGGEETIDLGADAEESPERLLDIEDDALQALQSQPDLLDDAGEGEEPVPALPEAAGADADAGDAETAVSEAAPAETTPLQDRRTAPPVAPRREPTLVEQLQEMVFSPVGLGAAAALLVLLLAGVLVMRKRREAARVSAAGTAEEWDSLEADDDATIIAGDAEAETAFEAEDDATAFAHEGTRTYLPEDDGATQFSNDAGNTQAAPEGPRFEDTAIGGQAVTLDENDPLSEADFHMAYGLYDQAAEVVEKAVERNPSRKDWVAKLAEIHFAGNNIEGFLKAARQLKELAGPGDTDWDNVAIMGRQIAPDDALFAEGGSTAAVDLDFGSAAAEFDGGETVINTETAERKPPASGDDLDFDLPFDPETDSVSLDEPVEPAPAAEPAAPASDDGGLDFDLDLGDLTPAAPEPEPAKESASDDSFDFDLGDLESADGEVTGTPASAESAPAAGVSYDEDETQTEFDKALQELSAYVDTNLPEQDAGDEVGADDTQGGDLNLDEFNFDQPDDGFGDDEAAGTGEDEDDIGEIGTKLDLARAYIDMGDPDGARGILDEVLADGDDDQKREARELLEQL